MNLELLKFCKASDAKEAKAVEKEIGREIKHQHTEMNVGLRGTIVNKWHKKAIENFGSVLMSEKATLVHFETNYLSYIKDRRNGLRLFTIDADFLLRIWDLDH